MPRLLLKGELGPHAIRRPDAASRENNVATSECGKGMVPLPHKSLTVGVSVALSHKPVRVRWCRNLLWWLSKNSHSWCPICKPNQACADTTFSVHCCVLCNRGHRHSVCLRRGTAFAALRWSSLELARAWQPCDPLLHQAGLCCFLFGSQTPA